jgi:hypothetical protein
MLRRSRLVKRIENSTYTYARISFLNLSRFGQDLLYTIHISSTASGIWHAMPTIKLMKFLPLNAPTNMHVMHLRLDKPEPRRNP